MRDPFASLGPNHTQTEKFKRLFDVIGADPVCCMSLVYKIGGMDAWSSDSNVETLEIDRAHCDQVEIALSISSLYMSEQDGIGGEMKGFKNGFLPL